MSNSFMWCTLANKIPIWERLKSKNIKGPDRCVLCKQDDEKVSYLFISCPFAVHTWDELKRRLNFATSWRGMSLEEAWIFQENLSVPELTTNLSIAILSYFSQQKDSHVVRNIFVEQINKKWSMEVFLRSLPKPSLQRSSKYSYVWNKIL